MIWYFLTKLWGNCFWNTCLISLSKECDKRLRTNISSIYISNFWNAAWKLKTVLGAWFMWLAAKILSPNQRIDNDWSAWIWTLSWIPQAVQDEKIHCPVNCLYNILIETSASYWCCFNQTHQRTGFHTV